MNHTSDITIIGAGINGLLTAKELLSTGLKITVLDKSQSGRESSWAGGGILLPLYPWRQAQAITDLVLVSLTNYPQLSSELLEATGIDPEWYDCGLLITKNPDIESAIRWCERNHIGFDRAGSDFFTPIQTKPDNPLWLPEIAQARNPRLLKSLKSFLTQAGVYFFENSEITDIQLNNHRVTQVKTSLHSIKTGQLIVAAGAWTRILLGNLLPELQQTVAVDPVKGQMLLIAAQPDTLPHMILDGDSYLIPRRDGNILVGSTVEHVGFDKRTSEQARDQLYQFATHLLPKLRDFPVVAHWAGLRPGSKNGVPFIDRHPEIDNLYINAGHFRNGLAMGPASAILLTDLILNRIPIINPEPYRISR